MTIVRAIMKRWLCASVSLLGLTASASAQNTPAGLQTAINAIDWNQSSGQVSTLQVEALFNQVVGILNGGTGVSFGAPLTIGGVTLAGVTGTGSMVLSTSPTLTTPNLGTPSALTLSNATGLPNAGLLNSSITLGSTSVSLGATATTLAGLSSVTSTAFVGSLTGGASLDLPLAGGALTGAVTQIIPTAGIFTADGSQFVSQTTSATALSIYRLGIPSPYVFFDVNRDTLVLNPGTTVQNADGYGVYIHNNIAEGTSPNQANAVGFFSFAVAQAAASETFGANFAWTDGGVTSKGIGTELDFTTSVAGDTIEGLAVIMQGVAPGAANGFQVGSNSTAAVWTNAYVSNSGAAAIALNVGALSATGVANGPSQPIEFQAWNGGSTGYTGILSVVADGLSFSDSEEACSVFMSTSATAISYQPATCTNGNLALSAVGTGTIFITASSVEVGASQFTANGSVATALSSIGPTGSHATVQEWFTIKDSGGTTRYIPAF